MRNCHDLGASHAGYVVGHKRDYLPLIEEARVGLFGEHKPTDALIGIATLSNPEYLIEVDAIAVV